MADTISFLDYLTDEADGWQQLDEAGLSRVLSHIDKRNLGFVSAFRGGSSVPLAQNRTRNRELQADIRQAGFGFLRVDRRVADFYEQPVNVRADRHVLDEPTEHWQDV